ncbi:MAG: response regulator transcription factor [Clostridiales bacterium]|nr:response regulator transcription factor [Clostridiales bacterium]
MNIIIVDDDRIVSQSLKTILEQSGDVRVVATGTCYEDALRLYEEHLPDILLMDIRMGQKTGLDAAEQILSRHSDARILFLTTFSDDAYILRALQMGAKGYLLKQDYESIGPALQAVASGQTVFGSKIVEALPPLLKPRAPQAAQDLPERELEVLRLCAEGLSNKEIAAQLYLSEGTVRNYISNLLQRFDLRDRTQLVVHYYKGMTE